MPMIQFEANILDNFSQQELSESPYLMPISENWDISYLDILCK